jgi:hypothetical protein
MLQYDTVIVFLLVFLHNIHQKLKKRCSHKELIQGTRMQIITNLILRTAYFLQLLHVSLDSERSLPFFRAEFTGCGGCVT